MQCQRERTDKNGELAYLPPVIAEKPNLERLPISSLVKISQTDNHEQKPQENHRNFFLSHCELYVGLVCKYHHGESDAAFRT
jgi:hypothetical protein